MESLKEQQLFELGIFCNIMHVFTVNQFNASLLNKIINFLEKKQETFCERIYLAVQLACHGLLLTADSFMPPHFKAH